jgi:hypothetical protein
MFKYIGLTAIMLLSSGAFMAGTYSDSYVLLPLDLNGGGTQSQAAGYTSISSTAQFGATGFRTGGPYSAHLGYIPPMMVNAAKCLYADFDFDGVVDALDLDHWTKPLRGRQLHFAIGESVPSI